MLVIIGPDGQYLCKKGNGWTHAILGAGAWTQASADRQVARYPGSCTMSLDAAIDLLLDRAEPAMQAAVQRWADRRSP
jgi:hypothetical protein